jgi:hypothetical protein
VPRPKAAFLGRRESHPSIAPAGRDRIGHGEASAWKRSDGPAVEAPPDERGGDRWAEPWATAPHLDSTDYRARWVVLKCLGGLKWQNRSEPEVRRLEWNGCRTDWSRPIERYWDE